MLIFSVPKPFEGEIGAAQRRAVRSWRELADRVILFGDEVGVADAATDLGVDHLGELRRNDRGTPFLDGAFRDAATQAGDGPLCFANADVVLGPDIVAACSAVERRFANYLVVGRTWDFAVGDADLSDVQAVQQRARAEGKRRGAAAIDWFVFPRGLFDDMPPFLVGRAGFDNWLLWHARQSAPVVDASAAVVAVHQPHAYRHLAGGWEEAYYGDEAAHNLELVGRRGRLFTLHDASHRLTRDLRLRRNIGATLRARERLRKVSYKLGRR